MKFGVGADIGPKQHRMSLKCQLPFFYPTSLTMHNRPIVKIFSIYILCPIWMNIGMGASIVPKTKV